MLEAIRARYQQHTSVSAIWQDKRLATAAHRHFGSRRAALVAAGVIPAKSVADPPMTKQRIKDAILDHYEKGFSLTCDENPDLVDYARRQLE